MAFLVRRAMASDAEGITDCLNSAFEAFRDDYTPEAFSDTVPTASVIERRLVEMCLFVAVNEPGEIVGTIGYKLVGSEEAHIRGMAVRPGQQGTGVAQQLLDTIETELGRQQCSRISLDTTQPLKRAISFYEKNGFHSSGIVNDFYGMPLFEYIKSLK